MFGIYLFLSFFSLSILAQFFLVAFKASDIYFGNSL